MVIVGWSRRSWCWMLYERGALGSQRGEHALILHTNLKKFKVLLILYTQTSVCIFSILFSIHFLRCWKGEFSIASFVDDHFLLIFLVTLVYNSGVLLYEEIRSQSLVGVNPLTPKISLVILLTVYHTIRVILAWRIWYWSNL